MVHRLFDVLCVSFCSDIHYCNYFCEMTSDSAIE